MGMQKSDGMNYAPKGKSAPVCRKGDFRVSVIGLDHGHILGMCNGLIEAGAELTGVYDPDPAKMENFRKSFPDAKAVSSEKAILEDPSVHLVASAAVPSDRGELGLRVMDHGKDYFSDKPPFTTLEQIAAARKKVTERRLLPIGCARVTPNNALNRGRHSGLWPAVPAPVERGP